MNPKSFLSVLKSENILKFNPYHDRLGRFTTAARASVRTSCQLNGRPLLLNKDNQARHMKSYKLRGTRSIFYGTFDDAQKLILEFAGTGKMISDHKERVNFNKVIGSYVNVETERSYDTTCGLIHYSKTGAHIVPSAPLNFTEGD